MLHIKKNPLTGKFIVVFQCKLVLKVGCLQAVWTVRVLSFVFRRFFTFLFKVRAGWVSYRKRLIALKLYIKKGFS